MVYRKKVMLHDWTHVLLGMYICELYEFLF